ncbi:hypothetical protein ABVT39_023589 [Epinephelus coioides]
MGFRTIASPCCMRQMSKTMDLQRHYSVREFSFVSSSFLKPFPQPVLDFTSLPLIFLWPEIFDDFQFCHVFMPPATPDHVSGTVTTFPHLVSLFFSTEELASIKPVSLAVAHITKTEIHWMVSDTENEFDGLVSWERF